VGLSSPSGFRGLVWLVYRVAVARLYIDRGLEASAADQVLDMISEVRLRTLILSEPSLGVGGCDLRLPEL